MKKIKKASKEIDIVELKKLLSKKVKEEYGSISKFSRSKAGLSIAGEATIRNVLNSSPKGGNSVPIINSICEIYDLPLIRSERVVKVTTTYYKI